LTRAAPTIQQNPEAEPTAADAGVPSVASSSVGVDAGAALSSVGQIVGDYFAIFNDVINDIKAGANLVDTAISGMPDTNSVINTINQIKPFLQTGADIAKTGADATGFAAQIAGIGAAGGPFGGEVSGILSLVSGVFSGVSAVFSGINQAIDVGEEIWQEASKFMGYFAGANLGGEFGPLGGNVQMLLNTQTGKIMASSLDNPKAQNIVGLPAWLTGVTSPKAAQQAVTSTLNIYAGPGQSTSEMMSDAMWSVATAPSAVSVAGKS
jgi:hypothetical protein